MLFPNAPDGIGKQYAGLVRAFGPEGAARIMANPRDWFEAVGFRLARTPRSP